jgi:hypothetical protein
MYVCNVLCDRIADDFEACCVWPTKYLLFASLIWVALVVSELNQFLCRVQIYIWGIFLLIWMYFIFKVVDRVFCVLSIISIHLSFLFMMFRAP